MTTFSAKECLESEGTEYRGTRNTIELGKRSCNRWSEQSAIWPVPDQQLISLRGLLTDIMNRIVGKFY